MLNLPNVTLISMGSTDITGMVEALEYSSKHIKFGCVKLVSHTCPRVTFRSVLQFEYTPRINSIDEWNRAIVFDLGRYVETDFALLIHPDGFVVHPESWKDEFLDYDYIGSPWPLPTDSYSYRDLYGVVRRVGNSVSIRSKKLMDLPRKVDMPWKAFYGNTNEDGAICVNYRHIFETFGCTYAPFELAVYFGREVPLPENEGIKPFVFHKHVGENANYPNFEAV